MAALANGQMYPVTDNIQTMSDALIVGLSEIGSTDVDPAEVMNRITEELKDIDFGMKK